MGASWRSEHQMPWTTYLFSLSTSFIVDGYDDAYYAELIQRFSELKDVKSLADHLVQGQ